MEAHHSIESPRAPAKTARHSHCSGHRTTAASRHGPSTRQPPATAIRTNGTPRITAAHSIRGTG